MNASVRGWLRWTASFVAFPVGGVLGGLIAGPVDSWWAALSGGLVTGVVVGLGQALLSGRRLPVIRWTLASAAGLGLGLMLGAGAVDFGTSLPQSVSMGALTGLALGVAQAIMLPVSAARRGVWVLALPLLWAVGWAVTTLVGVEVSRQFTVFGASGALTVSALAGVLLGVLLPVRPVPSGQPQPAPAASEGRS